MESKTKTCKHNVKLAFNNDEIVSYCAKCGKVLDRYVKENKIKTNIHEWSMEPCTSSISIDGTHAITGEHNTANTITIRGLDR